MNFEFPKEKENGVGTSFLFTGPTSISFFFSKSSLKKKTRLLSSEEIQIIESKNIDPDNAYNCMQL